MVTLKDAIAEATKNQRVCPQPCRWNELYNLLPDRQDKGANWEPALPLILAAWWDTGPHSKSLRLRKHLEWAESHGAIEPVYSFLVSLPESDWHHYGE